MKNNYPFLALELFPQQEPFTFQAKETIKDAIRLARQAHTKYSRPTAPIKGHYWRPLLALWAIEVNLT
jgi:hypothetical protein